MEAALAPPTAELNFSHVRFCHIGVSLTLLPFYYITFGSGPQEAIYFLEK